MVLRVPMTFNIIPINDYSHPGDLLGLVNGVAWHYTGSNGEPDATNINEYFENLGKTHATYASAHISVDRDEIELGIPWSDLAYHVGANVYKAGIQDKVGSYPNAHLWGVEICEDVNDQFPPETFANAVSLGAWFIIETRKGGSLAKYAKPGGLSTNDFYRHFDITGKACPLPWIPATKNGDAEWARFKAEVNALVAQYDNPVEEDECMKPMILPDWAWQQAYNIVGDSYNKGQIDWVWCQKILDRTMTTTEYVHIIAVIEALARGVKTGASNLAVYPPDKRPKQ